MPRVLELVDGEAVSAEMAGLLGGIYAEVLRSPSDLAALHTALRQLLVFLISPAGRTNANCWAADLFFCDTDGWERNWDHLPEAYQDMLGYLGGALHDTVSNPEIARNFDSTPEQLLTRLEGIPFILPAI